MSADEKKKAADIGEFLDVRNLTVQYTSMRDPRSKWHLVPVK